MVLAVLLLSFAAGCAGEKDPSEISVDPDMITHDWDAASVPVTVTTNSEWEASSSADWCRPSVKSGRTSQNIYIIIDESEAKTNRSAVITFRTTGSHKVVTTVFVSQAGEAWNAN